MIDVDLAIVIAYLVITLAVGVLLQRRAGKDMESYFLAGLLAAFMSTFDSTLNVAASFAVNDLIRPL